MLRNRTLKVLLCLMLLLVIAIPVGIASASVNNAPDAQSAFVKYGPGNGTSLSSSNVTIVWGSSSGATEYQYCYDTVNNSSCDSSWNSVGASTIASLTGLSNTTYYWQVRANGPGVTVYANGGTWWSFVVSVVPPTATPLPFGKSTPVNGATNQAISSLLLAWTASSGATRYEYCVDTSNNGSCDNAWVSTGTNQFVFLSGLAYSTTYSWQVRAVNASNVITYANSGAWWSFITGLAPTPTPTRTPTPLSPAFVKYAPGNGSTTYSPTIVWGSSFGVIQYQYCIDTSNNSACDTTWNSTGTTTMATLSGLTTNVPYYWQVRATNSSGVITYADGGTWWSFTLVPTPTPSPTPLAFGKSNPQNGTVWSPGSPLAWTASSGATQYQYCVDTVNNGVCDTAWVSTGTSTYAFVSFSSNTSYSWQVRAISASGTVYANNGTWWTFTTN